jgi:hypothetical protein
MGTWWGLNSDPLGLARFAPTWLLPNPLKNKVAEMLARRQLEAAPAPETAEPSPPAAPSETAASELPATDTTSTQTADSSPQVPADSDLSEQPEPESGPAETPEGSAENADENAAPPAAPAAAETALDLESDLESTEPESQPLPITTASEQPESAAPSTEDLAATEPDTLLDDLDEESANDSTASDFDALMEEPATTPDHFDNSANESTTDELALDDLAAAPAAAPTLGPADAPSFSSEELTSAISAAREADSALTSARVSRAPDLIKKAEQFYRAFAALAVTGTYVERQDADPVLKSARELLSSFEFDEKKQRMIANASRNWIRAGLGDGVFAAVTVSDVKRKGDLFELKATLMGKEATPLTLLTPIDPSQSGPSGFSTGDRILVLGVVVAEPTRKIEGYTGAATSVIWFTDLAVPIP